MRKFTNTMNLGILSRSIFYSQLEMGISIVAVSLPSIWLLLISVTPETVMRSVRSLVSLVSLRSRESINSREAKSGNKTKAESADKPNWSQSDASSVAGPAFVVTAQSGAQGSSIDVQDETIHVSRSVEQTTQVYHGNEAV